MHRGPLLRPPLTDSVAPLRVQGCESLYEEALSRRDAVYNVSLPSLLPLAPHCRPDSRTRSRTETILRLRSQESNHDVLPRGRNRIILEPRGGRPWKCDGPRRRTPFGWEPCPGPHGARETGPRSRGSPCSDVPRAHLCCSSTGNLAAWPARPRSCQCLDRPLLREARPSRVHLDDAPRRLMSWGRRSLALSRRWRLLAPSHDVPSCRRPASRELPSTRVLLQDAFLEAYPWAAAGSAASALTGLHASARN